MKGANANYLILITSNKRILFVSSLSYSIYTSPIPFLCHGKVLYKESPLPGRLAYCNAKKELTGYD